MTPTWRFDAFALLMAIVVEALLLVAAAYGGPHGVLGAWPWALQMPGIFVIFSVPGEAGFLWRVAAGATIQVVVWYLLFAFVRRRRRRARRPVPGAP